MDLKSEKKIIKGIWAENCLIKQEGWMERRFFLFYVQFALYYHLSPIRNYIQGIIYIKMINFFS
jgi:hypothetical protein